MRLAQVTAALNRIIQSSQPFQSWANDFISSIFQADGFSEAAG
jgi:hypothetical protein